MAARSKKFSPWIRLGGIACIVFIITIGSIVFFSPRIPTRIGIGIASDPLLVVSYDQNRKAMSILRIPSDTMVTVGRGYGSYPLSSVWKLDALDKRGGIVFTETLEEAIGIPVHYFIHPKVPVSNSMSPEDQVSSIFSFQSIVRMLLSKTSTNLSWIYIFTISRAISGMTPSDISSFDLSDRSVYGKEMLPDGNTTKTLDKDRLSIILGTHMEDAVIREENFRVAVYNPTHTPGLAQKAARIMEKAGYHVVTVANSDEDPPKTCVVKAPMDKKDSASVQALLYLFNCMYKVDPETSILDMTLVLGASFEKRYEPF